MRTTKKELARLGLKRLSDLIGTQVRLRRDVTNGEDETFAAGTVLWVTGSWRGMIDLTTDPAQGRDISQVSLASVERFQKP